MAQPFFTIGITTYNRRGLLLQALMSILAQTFTDFEVLVGNDYTDEVLSGELFGISDQRIHFINHPRNLQEVGNMNALLSIASGRYFTWLADDDLYDPDFLSIAHNLLLKTGSPPGFFSSYRIFLGTDEPTYKEIPRSTVRVLSGQEFLSHYFADRIKVIGVYGLFATDALREVVGGMKELCDSAIGLYGEYFFLVRCALLERIVYINAPLVLFREHTGSWGGNNREFDKYRKAGPELVRRCGEVLQHPSLSGDLTEHLFAICGIHLYACAVNLGIANVSQGNLSAGAIFRSIKMLSKETSIIRESFLQAGGVNGPHAAVRFAWLRCKYSLLIVRIFIVKYLRNLIS